MSSTFFGYQIARSGLMTSQTALNVTAHNLMNADTKGYTRQVINQQQILPYSGFLSASPVVSRGALGGGVSAVNVSQVRDLFLDNSMRSQVSKQNSALVKSDTLSYIESIFNETGKGSITGEYQNLLSAFQNLSAGEGAASLVSRENVKQAALMLCHSLNSKYNQLVEMQNSITTQLSNSISDVNSIAQSIADLNNQIYKFELGGQNANDLKDRRALLMDQLAEYTDFTVSYDAKGKATIKIGGEALVDGATGLANKMYTDADGAIKWSKASTDDGGNIVYTDTDENVGFTYGYIKAYMDIRDGAGGDYGINTVIEKLNTFAATLVDVINTVHREGYGLPPNSTNGVNFFDASEPVTAENIRLSDEIIENVNYIAAASKQVIYNLPVETDTETNEGQNKNLLNIIGKMNEKLTGAFGDTDISFEEYLRKMITELAGQVKLAEQTADVESMLLDGYISQRESISGVNIDEETINLLKYQRAYEAAARVLTIMDENINTILGMGLAGR